MGNVHNTEMSCCGDPRETSAYDKPSLSDKPEQNAEELRREIDELKQERIAESESSKSAWFDKDNHEKTDELDAKIGALTNDRTQVLRDSYKQIPSPVRGSSQEENMQDDPLANIVLDDEEQAKVDMITNGQLKYLNLEEHADDREVVSLLFQQIGSPADLEHLKTKFPEQGEHLFREFDLDGNGTISEAEFVSVIDAKYEKDPEKAAKWVKFLKSKIEMKKKPEPYFKNSKPAPEKIQEQIQPQQAPEKNRDPVVTQKKDSGGCCVIA